MILALDTCGPFPVVAAVDRNGTVRFADSGQRQRAHAEDLAPLLRAALACGDPDLVATGRGPGAFTGLRVGLVAAQTLAWAREIPAVGVGSLDVVAQQSGLADGWAILDARRGEVFLAHYAAGQRTAEPQVLPRDTARELVGSEPVCGDQALLTDPDRRARGATALDASALAAVAVATAERVASGDQPDSLTPLYLRAPDVTWSAANKGAGS